MKKVEKPQSYRELIEIVPQHLKVTWEERKLMGEPLERFLKHYERSEKVVNLIGYLGYIIPPISCLLLLYSLTSLMSRYHGLGILFIPIATMPAWLTVLILWCLQVKSRRAVKDVELMEEILRSFRDDIRALDPLNDGPITAESLRDTALLERSRHIVWDLIKVEYYLEDVKGGLGSSVEQLIEIGQHVLKLRAKSESFWNAVEVFRLPLKKKATFDSVGAEIEKERSPK